MKIEEWAPKLADLLPPDRCLRDEGALRKYGSDETEDFNFPPDVVLLPKTTEEVSRILSFCNAQKIPVTPRGAGTGLSGGAIPIHGGVCLSLEKMNRIVEIDAKNLFAVVEPGVVTQTLQDEVEKQGLFYPPDPASKSACMIGGNIAHNAGGPRALKYGVTKDYVYGLEAVLPSGEVIRTGGKLLKNVAGYNLTQLLVGSEGTLAVVTQATLKLVPLPRFRRTLLAPFDSVAAAAGAVAKVFQRGIVPCALEFMERSAVAAAEARKGQKFPHGDRAALLLVELDGLHEPGVEADAETACAVCMEEGASDVFVAETEEKRRLVWDLRRSIGEAVKKISPYRELDCVVPRARLPELMDAIRAATERHGLTAISYGHAGDGNIHVNILKRDLEPARWKAALPEATRELFTRVVALGGTITGEHGVGYVQRDYLEIALGPVQLDLLKRLKRQFDPNGILNPGKIWN